MFVILSSSKVREQRYTLLLYFCNLLILFCLSWESFVITLKNCKEIYYLHYSLYTLYKYHCIVLKDFPRLKFSYFSKYSVQFSSVTQLCLTLCDPMDCNMPGLHIHHQLPGFFSNSCQLSQWWHPTITSSVVLCSSCLKSFPASGSFQMSQLFSSVAKYWSFSFNISSSSEYSGLISFRIDWLDLLAIQRTHKSLCQHHSSKHQFFGAQLSL